jgi:fucose 4-O-acetylase-like acetyltransferase
MVKDRISWLDYGKCICMLMVILLHTSAYYTGGSNLFLDLLLPTRLVVFFFISGYLTKIETFNFRKTITSIAKKLLFPYFLFTSIIYLPKHLASGAEFTFATMLHDILGGFASWFVAALAVSKISLAVLLKYCKNIVVIGVVCSLLVIIGFLMTQYIEGPIAWHAQYGLISLVYLFPGMVYKKYESKLNKYIGWQAIISVILYFTCVVIDHFYLGASTYIYRLEAGGVTFSGVMSYLFLSFLGIWMMVSIVKSIPEGVKWMSYIGRNSLTYYYLNTGLLLVILAALSRLNLLCNSGWFIFPLFIVVVLILTVISQGILRYAPWMVGNFSSKKTLDKK